MSDLSYSRDYVRALKAENERLREALSDILSTVENANVPYERLLIGSKARAALVDE